MEYLPHLMTAYNSAKDVGINFEVVWITANSDESDYKEELAKLPWYSLPYKDFDINNELNNLFRSNWIPWTSV